MARVAEPALRSAAAGVRDRSARSTAEALPAHRGCRPGRRPRPISTSGSAPLRVPSTGVPLIIASTSVRPNGSSHRAGIHRQLAPASRSAFRSPSTEPTKRTRRLRLGRHPPATTSRPPATLGSLDRPAVPFDRVQPAEEEIVVGFVGTKDELRRVHPVIDEGGGRRAAGHGRR